MIVWCSLKLQRYCILNSSALGSSDRLADTLEVCHTFLSPLTTLSPRRSTRNHRNRLVMQHWHRRRRRRVEQIYSPYTGHIQHHTCVHKALPEPFSTGSKQGHSNNERGVWSASSALTNSTKERQASVCVFPVCCGSLGMCVCDKSPVSLQFTHCPSPAGTVMPPPSSAHPAPGATLQNDTELVASFLCV